MNHCYLTPSACRQSGRRQPGRQPSGRRGATAIETALAAPLLFLVFFSGLEFAWANMVRNVTENAALEGARAGILPGATAQHCIDMAQSELLKLNVQGATVSVTPNPITADATQVTVAVAVPMNQNALPLSKFVVGKTLNQSITLARQLD